MISIQNIRKSYPTKSGQFEALKGISLDIKSGEVLALLGVNGAGKTTLSSIISTLHPPSSGDILINNQSIYNDIYDYRKIFGYCPQRPNLDKFLSVYENLYRSCFYYGLDAPAAKLAVENALIRFNLHKYQDKKVHQLSGGYKQRVLIARACLHKPKIIIFDEPTVGLDSHIRRELWEIIKELKNDGVTIILTTHYLDEAEYLSDRVCILHDGKISYSATAAEIKNEFQSANLEDAFLAFIKNLN
jgi:ABC-2 type transport system ATP-binding protein